MSNGSDPGEGYLITDAWLNLTAEQDAAAQAVTAQQAQWDRPRTLSFVDELDLAFSRGYGAGHTRGLFRGIMVTVVLELLHFTWLVWERSG